MRRASYLAAEMAGCVERPARLCDVGRLAPRALPAPEGGEYLAEARKRLVLGGTLLVVDHQESLGARARLLRHPADGGANPVRGDLDAVLAGVARLLGEHAGGCAARAG